ncbi:hypothetical protein ACC722_38240, partial [Rhizobium ruizarguesonis]
MFKGTIDRGHLEFVAEPPMYPPPYPNISIKILDHPLPIRFGGTLAADQDDLISGVPPEAFEQ